MSRVRGEEGGGEPGLGLGRKSQQGGCEHEPRMMHGAAGSAELMGSDDVVLVDLLSQVKAVEEEGAQVDRLEVAVQHHLCHSSPHSRGLLEPMATEARGKVHVDDERVGTHHAILVEGVVVVIASPGTPNLRADRTRGFPGRCQHTPPSLLLRAWWGGSPDHQSLAVVRGRACGSGQAFYRDCGAPGSSAS